MSRLQTAVHAFAVPSLGWVEEKGALRFEKPQIQERQDWSLTKTILQLPPKSVQVHSVILELLLLRRKSQTSSICRVLEQFGILAGHPQSQFCCSGSMNTKYETWRLRSGGVTCKAAWTGSRSRCTCCPALHLSADITAMSKEQSDYAEDQHLGEWRRRGEEFVLSGEIFRLFHHVELLFFDTIRESETEPVLSQDILLKWQAKTTVSP